MKRDNPPLIKDAAMMMAFLNYLTARGYKYAPITYHELGRGCRIVVNTTDVSLKHFTEVRRRSRSTAIVILAKTDFNNPLITENLFKL